MVTFFLQSVYLNGFGFEELGVLQLKRAEKEQNKPIPQWLNYYTSKRHLQLVHDTVSNPGICVYVNPNTRKPSFHVPA